jgi:hypothetical protein
MPDQLERELLMPPPSSTPSETENSYWGAAPLTFMRAGGMYVYVHQGDLVPLNPDPADLERCLGRGYLEERTPDGFVVERA